MKAQRSIPRLWPTFFFAALLLVTFPLFGQEMPQEYRDVMNILRRTGDFKGGVLKVNIPRNDLHVSVAGMETPTPFGFGGWLALTKGDNGMDIMMGDLVLLEDEVNPVMSALLERGIEVTALHNHFFWETPRVFYMHVHGHGDAVTLARNVLPAIELIGHGSPAAGSALTGGSKEAASPRARAGGHTDTLSTERLAQLIGQKGETNGSVYKVTIGRPDVEIREMGARIDTRMGLNTWAAFTGTDDDAAVAGDIAMKEDELQSVLRALRRNGLDIVAIHHHMIGSRPLIIFLHYWGRGPAEKLALGFRAALEQLGPAAQEK